MAAEQGKANDGMLVEIAERELAEAALRESEEQYRTLVEAATDAVISVEETGRISFANHATVRLFGYDRSEVIGQPLTMLMPKAMRDLHTAGFTRYLATGKREINWHGTELAGLRKDGQEFPVEVSFSEAVRSGHRLFTGFIRDISERKQAEELRLAQTRQAMMRADVSLAFTNESSLGNVLQASVGALVEHLDAALARIWTLNQAEQLLELQASAGMDTHLDGPHSRVPVDDLQIGLIARDKKAFLTNDVVNDSRLGDRAWAQQEGIVAFAGYPLIVEDRVVGVVAMFSRARLPQGTLEILAVVADTIAQGIERKRAELALEAIQLDLARVARITTMGELVASIAHEINQPLATVVTNANACSRLLASEAPHLDDVRDGISEIAEAGTRASEVILRIRDLLKKGRHRTTKVRINQIIQEVIGLTSGELTRRGVSLRAELADDLPEIVGDRIQLQQVILNLVTNGMEALSAIAPRWTKDLVIKSNRLEPSRVAVEVADSGPGIPSDHLERVFEPFFTTRPDGMGMGLSICRSIVTAHGGRLWASSRPSAGATFIFTLPIPREASP
jgi:PAS domain S-box-containing protein